MAKRGEKEPERRSLPSGTSPEAARLAYLLNRVPLAPSGGAALAELPQVEPPSLEELEVSVPAPPQLTHEDLLARFHQLLRERAKQRERAASEPVQLGDEVELDMLGYSAGKLLPYSVRAGAWMELVPQDHLPGFAESIAGHSVGEGLVTQMVLPESYPVQACRGREVRFLIDIRAAREVEVLDPRSPSVLRRLGRGKTLDQVLKSIAAELRAEQADQRWVEAQDLVLDVLAGRVATEVPARLIDEEIRARWSQCEAPILSAKNFTLQEQAEALEGWLSDPLTRVDAERRLRVALALRAIAEREGLELTPAEAGELLEVVLTPAGVNLEKAREALREDDEQARKVVGALFHLKLVAYVMDRAKINFESA